MVRAASLILVPAIVVGAPALAREHASQVDLPGGSLPSAIRALSVQGQASIGFSDARIAKLRATPVRGRYTVAQALERMLAGTNARARRVAPASYVIERVRRARVVPRAAPIRPDPLPAIEDPAVVEDVVVTATKRDVPLEFYAGGAQVISGDDLTMAQSARGTDAIETRAASVSSTHLGPGRNKLFIRGIADSSFVGPTQATVGQYWGNSRLTYSAPDPSLRLYDVGQIEVLEGPQGTLYGAGSLGGVVRVVPRAPDLFHSSGQVWGGAQIVEHGKPGIDGGAILNLPIAEGRLALRALAFGSIDGGYIDDRHRGLTDVNRVETAGGRATLRYDAGNDWLIDLSGLAQRIDGADGQYADRVGDGLSRASSIAQPYRNDYWLADLVARKRWDDIELTTSLGYARQHVFEQFEGPKLANILEPEREPVAGAAPTAYTQHNRIRMVTGEVRLARRGPAGSGWLIAGSFLHNVGRVRRSTGEQLTRALLTGVRNQIDEATLYGEYGFVPAPGLNVTVGGRLTRTRLAGDSEDVDRLLALSINPGASDTREEVRALPSASVSWRPNDSLTLFARYQEGFRPGGIAVRQYFIQRFDGDRVSTAEVGVRRASEDFDSALTVSWSRWRDIQADLIDGFGFPTTANIGDGRVLSFGWTGRWRPAAGLEIDAALYLNDSRIVAPAQFALTLASGAIDLSRLPNVADATGRVGASYTAELSPGTRIDVNGYARYIGRSTLGIGSILGRVQGDHLDTGLEVSIGNGRRRLSLSATNLLDSVGNRFALGSPFLIRDQDQITPLQPRTFRIGVEFAL